MIGFLFAGCVLLGLVAALLLSRRSLAPRAADGEDPNLGWYQLRAAELDSADDALMDEARLRLLEDAGSDDSARTNGPASLRFPVLPLVLLIAVSGIAIYWKTGAIEDVLIYESLVNLRPESSDAERDALMRRVESRSRARQDNLQYLGLLGQLYMADEDFPAASRTYMQLVEKAPQDSQG